MLRSLACNFLLEERGGLPGAMVVSHIILGSSVMSDLKRLHIIFCL